jgi:3',5'-cyclic AMP phosphodiesterase CpdA
LATSGASVAAAGDVIAVGDLHGDRDATIAVLRLAGLVDTEGHWVGGGATLVQTGDVTDRGPDSRGVIALLRSLQVDAARAGGRVVPLLGNHEVMNVRGDWRYVSPEDLAGYGGEAPRRQAFGPTGEDGAWLRARDSVARIGDTVFAHGGVSAAWARSGIDALNAAVRAGMDATEPPPVLGPDGPLWNRAYLLADEATACAELERALSALGARRMVVGHTTQRDGRIGVRCGGALQGIDTGISTHYGRNLAALRIVAGQAAPLYPDADAAGGR